MGNVNVLIVSTFGLHRGYLEDISAVDQRISVNNGTRQFVTELRQKGRTGPRIDRLEKEAAMDCDTQVSEIQEDLDTLLAQAEVIFVSALIYSCGHRDSGGSI